MTRAIRHTALAASVAALLLLSACGKDETATPTTGPAASGTVASATSAALPPEHNVATSPMPALSSAGVARSASVAAPAAAAPISVASLTLGSEVDAQHEVTHASKQFASNDKAIYASVVTEGASSGATLNATWRYLEGNSQLVSSISQSIATEGHAITTFEVQNPDLWPQGKYQVVISLDGKQVAKQAFEIKQG